MHNGRHAVPQRMFRLPAAWRVIASLALSACISIPDATHIGNQFGPLPGQDSIAVVEFNDWGFALQDTIREDGAGTRTSVKTRGALQLQAALDFVDATVARTHLLDSLSVAEPGEPRIRRQVLVLTYTHGWHNNADTTKGDFTRFRALIDSLRRNFATGLQLDLAKARRHEAPDDSVVDATTVVPIYVAWRGKQYKGLADYLTFWSRKQVAQRVGEGEYAVLVRSLSERKRRWLRSPGLERNMLVLTGHSFGAAALLSATLPSLARHLLETDGPASDSGPPPADVIVAVNPAIEANVLQRSVLSELTRRQVEQVTDKGISDAQGAPTAAVPPAGGPRIPSPSVDVPSPTRLAILDAENDRARQVLFPLGRRSGSYPWFWSTVSSIGLVYGFRHEKAWRFTATLPWVVGLVRARDSRAWSPGEVTAAGRLSGQPTLRAELSPSAPSNSCLNTRLPSGTQGRIVLRPLTPELGVRECANPVKVITVSKKIIDNHGGLWSDENLRFVQELLLSNMRRSRIEQDTRSKAKSATKKDE